MTAHLYSDAVRLEIGVERIVDRFGLQGTMRNGWYKLRICPRCGEKSSREAIAIEMSTGRWLHHGRERAIGGDCSGDIFDLVAACEGLDTRKDFGKVLALAADIAGMAPIGGPADPELESRVAQRLRERQRQDARDQARRQAAAEDAAAYWEALALRSDAGETYLTRRGLDPYPLIRAGAVRFNPTGDPCVAIHSVSGRVTTVATRFIEPGDRPKVLVRRGTTTEGTMIDAVDAITFGRPVVIVEGVMDALTARLAWPRSVILGANGAGNCGKVARAAITRLRVARTSLTLVPHDDDKGINGMTTAGQIALGAGLGLDINLHVLSLAHKDLNDAWRAGWRPAGFVG